MFTIVVFKQDEQINLSTFQLSLKIRFQEITTILCKNKSLGSVGPSQNIYVIKLSNIFDCKLLSKKRVANSSIYYFVRTIITLTDNWEHRLFQM